MKDKNAIYANIDNVGCFGKPLAIHWILEAFYNDYPTDNLTIVTARKRNLGQGNIFTPVCHSVHRGGGSPNFRGEGFSHFSGGSSNFLGGSPIFREGLQFFEGGFSNFSGGVSNFSGGVSNFFFQNFFWAYGQRAGGTHPTGMHSC